MEIEPLEKRKPGVDVERGHNFRYAVQGPEMRHVYQLFTPPQMAACMEKVCIGRHAGAHFPVFVYTRVLFPPPPPYRWIVNVLIDRYIELVQNCVLMLNRI
jgi:hypothetical protein